jgi:succinate dehydrogenase / fumarate reductase cytochrome b subunit
LKQESRPIFQAVFKYRYPITAITSVLHRISGIILFFLIPLLLWLLNKSLTSTDNFQAIQTGIAHHPILILVSWLILAALLYHLVAGIRHLLMDSSIGESYKGGKISAYAVYIVTIILLVFLGIWLFL